MRLAMEYTAKQMEDDWKRRGPLPEDMGTDWMKDYYRRGDEAILGPSEDDIRLEQAGRKALLESNRKADPGDDKVLEPTAKWKLLDLEKFPDDGEN